jgi:hypothetical protein
VTATGTNLRYQWLFNDETISGATGADYMISDVQPGDDGHYSVLVSNSAGTLRSDQLKLTVQYPHTALARATVVNGFVVGYGIIDQGFGYTNIPTVRVFDSAGSGAEAAVTNVNNGVVIGIGAVNPGQGYTPNPVVVVAPPFIPPPKMDIAALSLVSCSRLAVGTHYQLEYLSGGSVKPVGPSFIATNSTFTQMLSGPASTTSYRLTPVPAPLQAKAKAVIVNGFVVGVTNLVGGSGYATNPGPSVLIYGDGSGAVATATLTGDSVTHIVIVNPGSDYTTANIVIDAPAASSLAPDSVKQVMKLVLDNLSPYDNYQLEFTPAFTKYPSEPIVGPTGNGPESGWNDLNLPFTPTSTHWTEDVDVHGNVGFFKVRYVR